MQAVAKLTTMPVLAGNDNDYNASDDVVMPTMMQ